jgi:hypothetical protein
MATKMKILPSSHSMPIAAPARLESTTPALICSQGSSVPAMAIKPPTTVIRAPMAWLRSEGATVI